jgi:hypothetical protein
MYHLSGITIPSFLVLPLFLGGGHAVALLVEALCYKSEGRGIDSQWGHWNIQVTSIFQPHYGPGVDSATNRTEHQVSSWG